MRSIGMIAGALLVAVPSALLSQTSPVGSKLDQAIAAAGKQWQKEYLGATRYTFDCFGKQDDKACLAMIASYDRAMKAPDADVGSRHETLKKMLHAETVHGKHLRERGDHDSAMSVLDQAFKRMIAHYDNGSHAHTLIENLGLISQLSQTLLALGNDKGALNVLSEVRRAADEQYAMLEASKANAHRMELQHLGMLTSEDIETEFAGILAARATALDKAGKKAEAAIWRDRAITAYRRSEQWIRRSTAAGITGSMDIHPRIRVAEVRIGLGEALLAKGARKEATEAYLQAGVSCEMLDKDIEQKIAAKKAIGADQMLAYPVCNKATLGWMEASGELGKLINKLSDEWYKEQMKILATPVPLAAS